MLSLTFSLLILSLILLGEWMKEQLCGGLAAGWAQSNTPCKYLCIDSVPRQLD